jgi:hypothetical protein
MTRNGKLVFAGLAAAALGLATAGAVAYGDWGHGRGGWRHHGGGMGFMGLGGFGGPFARLCRGNSAEMADHLLVRIEHRVKPTDAQKGAFEELKTATRAAAAKIAAACQKDAAADAAKDGAPRPLSPLERLDRAEAQLAASIEAIKTVRPAAEKFYAALDDTQKAKLTERRGRHHWRRAERESDGKGAAGPGSSTAPPSEE